MTTAPLCWNDLTSHRSHLVQFAQRRLMDPCLAEDVVHDVFEAVMTGRAMFSQRSALRTWLVGILKHKIVDVVRQRSGTDSLDATRDGEDAPDFESPDPGPDELADQRQRLARTLQRIDGLPPSLRDVMHLRVLQDRSAEEVCEALAISEDNLFVRLHRARKQLLS